MDVGEARDVAVSARQVADQLYEEVCTLQLSKDAGRLLISLAQCLDVQANVIEQLCRELEFRRELDFAGRGDDHE